MQIDAALTEYLVGRMEGRSADPRQGAQAVFSLVYEELKRMARGQRRAFYNLDTLNTTAVLHEAYLKMDGWEEVRFESRAHFFASAARIIRHVLINYAERKGAEKRGGHRSDEPLDDWEGRLRLEPAFAEELLSLHQALQALSAVAPRQSEIVENRFFGGMTVKETAEAMDLSPATVKRDWALAQAWLFRYLQDNPNLGSD